MRSFKSLADLAVADPTQQSSDGVLDDCEPDWRAMEHPVMFRDDDFGLAEVREICLALPEAHETISFGRPWFRVKTAFAVFGGGTSGPEKRMFRSGLLFHPDADTRLALFEDPRFFVPAYMGPGGWMGLDLLAAPVDWQEVAELVDESYRHTAPKRLVAQLDARAGGTASR